MKLWLAEVIDSVLNLACLLTNHAGGCWLYTGGPFKRIAWWATEVQYAARHDPDRPHDCAYCGKRGVFVPFSQVEPLIHNNWTFTTASTAASAPVTWIATPKRQA